VAGHCLSVQRELPDRNSVLNSSSVVSLPPMRYVRQWPRPWLFGLLILPLGIYVGFIWTALPLLLSQAGLAIGQIARINAILQVPPILMFLWTPVVDVKLRRRTWLVLGALATALLFWLACQIGTAHVRLLTAFLFFAGVVVALVPAGCGGLMATMLSPSGQAKASAWNQAGNWGGVGLGGALILWLVAQFSLPAASLTAAALVALPAFLAFTITEPPPAVSFWFRGRFAQFRKEALALFRSPRRRWSVLLLLAPGSTCAAQTLLPALASHYGVGATGVLWTNGVAGGIVLALGSLSGVLIPADWDRRFTYAGAGLTNAFAAIWLLAGNRPFVYLWGTLLYLLTAGLCNARFIALVLDIIGPDDQDTSTWYSALVAASNIPIASMTWLEGQSYTKFGTHGLLWTDGAVNFLVFTIVALAFATHGLGIRGVRTSQVKPDVSTS
jgi:PAT family beta-lactamase induction signal transducer AmpG